MLNVEKLFGGQIMNEINFANVLRLVLAFVVLSAFARIGWDVVKGFIDGYFDARNGEPFDDKKNNDEVSQKKETYQICRIICN